MSDSYTLTSDIPYVSDGHPRQTLDIYTPKSSSSSNPAPFPCIIYIHGGAFKHGSKESSLIPLRLLSHSYAIASLNYRLSGDSPFPAAVQDCKAAVRFLRGNSPRYNLDADRFVVMGESAGGYMASMVGITSALEGSETQRHPFNDNGDFLTTSPKVKGVIDFYGPSDFAQMDEYAPPDAAMKHNAADSPESLFLGRQITEVPELVRRANPITYISDEEGVEVPAVFIAHGTGDRVVPYHQSVLLYEALVGKGREAVLYPVQGADHVFNGITEEQQGELDAAVDRWLERVVGK